MRGIEEQFAAKGIRLPREHLSHTLKLESGLAIPSHDLENSVDLLKLCPLLMEIPRRRLRGKVPSLSHPDLYQLHTES